MWENKFFIRKHASLEWEEIKTCFGIWGLYTALGAEKAMPDGFKLAEQQRWLNMGGHVTIGDYEVKRA